MSIGINFFYQKNFNSDKSCYPAFAASYFQSQESNQVHYDQSEHFQPPRQINDTKHWVEIRHLWLF